MNRIYRLVFNHALRLWQVASELVKSPRGGATGGGGAVVGTLPPLRFAMYVALGFVTTMPAFAQAVDAGRILVDRTAPGTQRPTVVEAPNGTPVVNIQTPSAQGVSRNNYSQFDVGNQGVILNNSRTNADTQLGGGIEGNPWLARGTARVILNEVSGPASQLNGYVEVGGDRAEVIIANPSGIQVNGGGFLNASRATLATGTPIFTGGNLDGYRVEGGAIRVDGKGLDATHTDYTDLIARSLEVNAGVWAQQMRATLGATVTGSSTAAPHFALDVSAMGGMYANKIHLIGTEAGVGVRNAGEVGAMAEDLVVTVDGRIENTGTLQARHDTHLDATGGVANAGTLSASRELTVTTPADVDNSGGTLNARRIEVNAQTLRNRGGSIEQTGVQALALNAESLSNRDDGRIGLAEPVADNGGSGGSGGSSGGEGGSGGGSGGGNSEGGSTGGGTLPDLTPLANGALNIAGVLNNDGGKINAGGGVGLNTATGINNDGGHLGLGQLTITHGDLTNAGGELIISGDASVHADRIVNDAGRLEVAGAMDLAAQSLSNRGGALVHAGTSDARIAVDGVLDNTDGTLASNAAKLTIGANALVNERGTFQHAGANGLHLQIGDTQANAAARPVMSADPTFIAARNLWLPGTPPPAGALMGAGGQVVTAGALTLDADRVDHRGATLSATQLTVTANDFDNSAGQLIASGAAANTLQVFGIMSNTGGLVASNADLTLRAGWLNNTDGTLQHAGEGTFALDATRLYGTGGTLVSNGTLGITGGWIGLDGGITQAQRIGINADILSNRGGTLTAFSADPLTLTARQTLDNTGGTVQTNGALSLNAGMLVNRDTKVADGEPPKGLLSAGEMTVDAQRIDNAAGTVVSSAAVTVRATDVNNQGGQIQAADTLTVTATGVLDNSVEGVIASNGDTALAAATLNNTSGTIQHSGAGTLAIDAATLSGAGGRMVGNGALSITGTTTDLRGATTFAQSVNVDTTDLTTAGGTLTATGAEPLRLSARGTLDNTAGAVQTNGALDVRAGTLINRDTRAAEDVPAMGLLSVGPMTVNATRIDNTTGTMAAGAGAKVRATELINQGGTVQATEALTVHADGLLDNRSGRIAGNGAIDLHAGSMTNTGGIVQTQQTVTASVSGTLDNSAGTMVSGDALSVTAGTLINRDTFDASADADAPAKGLFGRTVALSAGSLDNTRGQIQSTGSLALTGGDLTNAVGVIGGAGTVTVSATSLDNSGGQLVQYAQDGALTVTTTGALTNTGGQIGSLGSANLHAGRFDNSAGTAFGWHGLTVRSDGDLINRDGGFLSAGQTREDGVTVAALDVRAGGQLDNSGGALDATGSATVNAAGVTNAGGQIVAGTDEDAESALTLTTAGLLDNRSGTLASRGGDVQLQADALDNRDNGRVVATRDLTLNVNHVSNDAGTVFAGRSLRFENAAGTLDNGTGMLGAGDSATLTLANLSNATGGLIQAGTLWLSTPNLHTDGKIVGNEVHAQLANLTGTGTLYGTQWLDVDVGGDFTYGSGPLLQSDTLLDLSVVGTFTNIGTLQTPGELALTAGTVINDGVINASNAEGSGYGHITAGRIENRRGASLEGDWLELTADVVTNTGEITGDGVGINADTLTNGQTGTATLASGGPYAEGFIGAADYLALEANLLRNLDAEIYSGGGLDITGRGGTGTRAAKLENVSGRIQAEGDAYIAADEIDNTRRALTVQDYALTPDEQYAVSSQRQFDEAFATLTDAERQRLQYLNSRGAANLSAAEIVEKKALNHKVGWQTVDHVSDAMLAAINTWYRTIGAPGYGASDGYIIDNGATPNDNPGAELIQRDTYTTGQRLVEAQTSAESQILTGGNLNIDSGGAVRNHASRIAAGDNLVITGNPIVENTAVAALLTGERETQAWVYPEIPAMYLGPNGWRSTIAEVIGFMHEAITAEGPMLASATITANGGVLIEAGDVTNTAVTAGGGLDTIGGGAVGTGAGTAVGAAGSGGTGAVSGVDRASGGAAANQTGPAGAAAQVVGSPERPLPGSVPPDNGRFHTSTDPNSPYLVTTAPRFAKGDGTGSDYLMARLGVSTDLHKRLGDGYYEQQLVLDQILQLTGRRSLGGDPLTQYRDLMDAAAAEAARLGLPLGAPLTSDQIAALSQDIVWLVEQEVNGQKVLVPVVYLSKATAERLAADGALIDGDTLDVRSTGTLRNDGTLSGSKGAWLSADTLINDGAIRSGGQVGITTQHDTVNRGVMAGHSVVIDAGGDVVNTVKFNGINATAGQIQVGAGGLSVTAGRDVINQGVINSDGVAMVKAGRDVVQNAAISNTTAGAIKAPAGSIASTGSTLVQAGRDVTLDQSRITAGEHLVVDAGRDANFVASDMTAGGSMAVTAGRDINATTVTETTTYRHYESVKEGKKKTSTTTTTVDETVHGSTFKANGDMAFVSEGGNIDMVAATVRSENGAVGLLAKNGDVTLRDDHETDSVMVDSASKKKNTLSTTKTTSHFESHDTRSVGTTVSGKTVAIGGNNITLTGSTVVSDEGTTLMAKNNVTIEAGTNTYTESTSSSKTKSGVFGDGGTGFVIGKNKQSQTTDLREVTHTGSVVGSVDGRVDIYAGGHYQQTGSDVIGMEGVGISGSTVTIQNAEDTLEVNQTQKTSSAGIHVSVKGGAADAANTAYQSAKRAGEVEDDRLSALYVAKGAQALYAGGSNPLGNIGGQVDQAVSDAKTGGQTPGGMSLRIGIGGSSSKAETEYRETTAHGSTVYSGNGDATVIARDGDMNVIGSRIEGINTAVAALNGDLNLRSAEQTTSLREKNSAKSGEVGFTMGSEAGMGVYVSASGAKGKGTGDSTSYAETVIGGNRGTTTFVSGGNTTLEGAQVIGDRVIGQVGGDFTVRSQQDTDSYKRKDESAGIDVAVGTGGASVSANYAQSKVDSNYTSVREQSGVQAGSGGFQIDVKGHTQLDGGAIASTADPGKNHFSTGSLGFTDLKNEAEYKATSVSVSVSGGSSGGSGSGGYANTSDKASSTTKAGIGDGTLVVKDGSGAGIARGTAELQQDGLKEIYDAQKVAETMEIQQVAGQVGFTAAGDLAQAQQRKSMSEQVAANDRLAQAEANGDQAGIDAAKADLERANQRYEIWKEGGSGKTITHAVAGALSAGLGGGVALDGALGAAAAELARPLTEGESKFVQDLVSFAIGGAVGGTSGASTALSGEVYNRRLHPDEIGLIDRIAEDFARQQCGCDPTSAQVQDAQSRLMKEAAAQVDKEASDRIGSTVDEAALTYLNSQKRTFEWGTAFSADERAYNDSTMFSGELAASPAAFQSMYNALLAGGVDKQALQQMYEGELIAFADSGTDSVAKGVVGGYAAMATIGASLALAPGAVAACAKNPVVCGQALADMAMGDAIGGGSLALPVAGGAAAGVAHLADEISDTARAAARVESLVPSSPLAREALRNDLANQAGIPRSLDQVWGSSSDDLARAFEMDGATLALKPPKSGTSGNGAVYTVEGHSLIKEVEVHSGNGAHGGAYYKFVYKDGTQVRVIDPATYDPGTITRKQMFDDPQGNRLRYEQGKWLPWN